MSLETAQKVIVPQKKIMSRSFLNSGTLIAILGWFCPIEMTYQCFSVPGKSISKYLSILAYDKPESLSPGDDFKLLVSSNPLFRFRLVASRDLAVRIQPSSGIFGLGRMRWLILKIDLPGTK